METDDALYCRYLDGDEDALGELMERHGTKLTLYLDGYLCDLHEAEDLMIEAFAYLIAKRPAIRDGGFRAYLYQSARHMALRLLRKKRAGNCFSLDALTEEPEARELVLGYGYRRKSVQARRHALRKRPVPPVPLRHHSGGGQLSGSAAAFRGHCRKRSPSRRQRSASRRDLYLPRR